MEIFLDTAQVDEIRRATAWGVVTGVTTNPTLMARAGGDPETVLKTIAQLVPGPVSAEVIATDAEGMVREGRHLASLADNIVVKVPMTPAGLEATHRLAREGIRVNVTLVFQPGQALLAARAGATFVSPFVGRLDDVGEDGIGLVEEIVAIFRAQRLSTRVLAASIRHPRHVIAAARVGADIATMPMAVLEQLMRHPLTDAGLARFLADWEAARKGETEAAAARR
ncbi:MULTISPECIES: fructose-6-phosphate aldolase [Thermaerobacter]|uniref:Probable transaldolase n=1 Tax=Thermaerobacter composti TaxID=554949 RepID=A0ABZ0QPN2_9FIRM|nr:MULTISPECIES: fructose-6-phosphate aldolase [Thermaerobacter]QBS37190.1 fructose-6-phosphate aldolase [Thermaerobacter sp. FW80]WPD19204.1 fructose-6-phosphate aldolase [Thermaerobacter composti]